MMQKWIWFLFKSVQFLWCVHCSGDLWSYNAEKDTYVVSPKPDVTVLDINENHSFVILATDGLWHVVEPAEAVDTVARLAANMVIYYYGCPSSDLCQKAILFCLSPFLPRCIIRRRGLAMRILSVRLSVCQTRDLWQNGRKIGPDFYTIRKNI